MTSDAKIGLLLGLVFIFIIAFIINGLPGFRNDTNNNELTTKWANQQNGPPGIAGKERKAQEVFNWEERIKKEPVTGIDTTAADKEKIRYTTPLEDIGSIVRDALRLETTDKIDPVTPASITANKTEVKEPESTRPALPQTYVVVEGDSLAEIAKKFYGPEEGNKRINVTRIFEANRKLLKLADEIYVGQQLVIPPLATSTGDKGKIGSTFSTTLFERVQSIGRKPLSAKGLTAKQSKQYVVREGDSLWRIATERLGDGSRYKEIYNLNTGILDDEDSLVVGMRLRMPAR